MVLQKRYGQILKTIEWFTCLSFGSADILFLRDAVLECVYEKNPVAGINIDLLFETQFHFTVPAAPSCVLYLSGQCTVVTGASPVMVEISLKEMCPIPEILCPALSNAGFIAFRFINDRVQYVIDIEKVVKKSEIPYDQGTHS